MRARAKESGAKNGVDKSESGRWRGKVHRSVTVAGTRMWRTSWVGKCQ